VLCKPLQLGKNIYCIQKDCIKAVKTVHQVRFFLRKNVAHLTSGIQTRARENRASRTSAFIALVVGSSCEHLRHSDKNSMLVSV